MNNHFILQTKNLQKSFSGIIAAENINISVKEGEIIGIIGPNGAGKTVFVNMITGYLKPTSGKIHFLGNDITGIKPREATHIGVCRSFQVSQVFMTMTVKQNLMIAMSLSKKKGGQLLLPLEDEKLSKECDKILDLYKIKKQSDALRNIGYDTFMLFVNTSLEVAIERDKNRDRVLGEEEVTKMWKAVQSNMGKFQSYFGRESFILIDNNNVAAPVPRGAAWEKGIFDKLYVEIGKLIRTPPTSRAANAWMKSQRPSYS